MGSRLQGPGSLNSGAGGFSLFLRASPLGFLSTGWTYETFFSTTVQGPPYKGGGSLDLQVTPSSTHTRSPTLSLVLPNLNSGLYLDSFFCESLSPHGPWSACFQPSPCDLYRDSALAFLVLAGLLSGSMGLPIKYPPVSSPRIYLGCSFVGFLFLLNFALGSTPWVDSLGRLLVPTPSIRVAGSEVASCWLQDEFLQLKHNTRKINPYSLSCTSPPL